MEKLYRNGIHCGNLGDPALYYALPIKEVAKEEDLGIRRCDK